MSSTLLWLILQILFASVNARYRIHLYHGGARHLRKNNINFPNYDNLNAFSDASTNYEQKLFGTKFGGMEPRVEEAKGVAIRGDTAENVLPIISSSFDVGIDGNIRKESSKMNNMIEGDIPIRESTKLDNALGDIPIRESAKLTNALGDIPITESTKLNNALGDIPIIESTKLNNPLGDIPIAESTKLNNVLIDGDIPIREPAKLNNAIEGDAQLPAQSFAASDRPFNEMTEISRIKSMYDNPHENVIKYLDKRNKVSQKTIHSYPDDEALGEMLKSFELDDVKGNIFHRGHHSNFDDFNQNAYSDPDTKTAYTTPDSQNSYADPDSTLSNPEKEMRAIFNGR